MAGVQGRVTRDLFGQSLHILGKLVIDEKWNLYVANTFQDNAHINGTTFTNGLSEFEAEQGINVIGNITMQNDYVLCVNNFKVTNIIGTDNIFVKGNIISQKKICADSITSNSIVSNSIVSNTITSNSITSNTMVTDILLSDIIYSNDVYSNIIWTNTIAPLASDEINIIGNIIASNVYCTNLQVAGGGFTLGNSAVTTTMIADGAITNSKIQLGTITGDRIASGTINSNNLSPSVDTTPVGILLDFAGTTAPPGYLICDGSAVSTTTYAALFAVIGYLYGGAGPLFNIPDFRGRFARYADNMGTGAAGRDLGTRDANLAQTQSTATNGLTIATDGSHTHSVSGTYNGTASAAPGTGMTNLNENFNLNFPGTTAFGGTHSHTIVEPVGAETRPINVQCYKIIKY